MYILDTNVLSELRRHDRADKAVINWVTTIDERDLFLSVITILEIELGMRMVARRDPAQGALLEIWINQKVIPAFRGRILSIDTAVAQCCARLHIPNRRSERDALIGATALVHDMTVVTRNISDFQDMGLRLINPFDAVR
jgi:predicted nucleic acid-binding protein